MGYTLRIGVRVRIRIAKSTLDSTLIHLYFIFSNYYAQILDTTLLFFCFSIEVIKLKSSQHFLVQLPMFLQILEYHLDTLLLVVYKSSLQVYYLSYFEKLLVYWKNQNVMSCLDHNQEKWHEPEFFLFFIFFKSAIYYIEHNSRLYINSFSSFNHTFWP